MNFSLNIGTTNKTIDEYINQKGTLGDKRVSRNAAITNLSEHGWAGEGRDSFLKAHEEKMKLYEKLEQDMQTMIDILKDEKERALQLKRRSDGFINCIKRNGGELAATDESNGIVALQYSGQFQINNHVNNCLDEDFVGLNHDFNEIENILSELEYTSFGIKGDVESAKTSVRNQTQSLTDFDKSFNMYCAGVKELESYICSQFTKISGLSERTFKNSSFISPSGKIEKNEVLELMLKNPDALTDEEKAMIAYAKAVLGNEECNEMVNNVDGPTLDEAAELAEDVYFDGTLEEAKTHDLPGGWKMDYVEEPQGYSVKVGVYKRTKPNGEVEYALVNRGSRDWNNYAQDWDNNFKQPLGLSDDMNMSIKIANEFMRQNPGVNVTCIGHSKGGAEAAANAVSINKNAILFNPASVNLDAYKLDSSSYSGDMTAYVVKGEILNDIEDPISKPIGKEVYLPTQYPVDYTNQFFEGNPVKNHLMPAVKSAVKEYEADNN